MYGLEESKVTINRRVYRVQYHRNGIGGTGFFVVRWREGGENMLGVVFEGDGQIAVLNQADPRHTYKGDDTWGKVCREVIRAADKQYEAQYGVTAS